MTSDGDEKSVEANVNVCRPTGLKGVDRREMASTCCITGPSTHLYPTVAWRAHKDTWGQDCILSLASRGMDVLLCSCLWSSFFKWLTSEHCSASRSTRFKPPHFSCWNLFFYLLFSLLAYAHLPQVVFQPPQAWRWSPCSRKRLLPTAAFFSFYFHAVCAPSKSKPINTKNIH